VRPVAGFVIALLGASGVQTHGLARTLQSALTAQGHTVALVADPNVLEDAAASAADAASLRRLIEAQARHITEAAACADTVVTLCTPWQTAVQSALRQGQALVVATDVAAQWPVDLTLLLAPTHGPDAADALASSAHDVQSLDTLLRDSLDHAGLPYGVLTGSAPEQLAAALAAIARARSPADTRARWQWVCERCGDGGCERHLLRTT
jgi:predicted dinucleotide-binding enzyme